ncbi:hypothetical protein [Singulisphaera acidiphila]|nr:hypothetical protein [Singulisphaera acidiphila]
MPRTARASVGGLIAPTLNRGNRRQAAFPKAADAGQRLPSTSSVPA